jgi:CheY-like chemotaxis protein
MVQDDDRHPRLGRQRSADARGLVRSHAHTPKGTRTCRWVPAYQASQRGMLLTLSVGRLMHVEATAAQGTGDGRCVLVVEDHSDTLRLLLRLLDVNGYAAHGAVTVAEAILTAERERCDILVTDLELPDGSGIELLRTLRVELPELRGIAVTGHAGTDLIAATAEAGFSAHLLKPVRFDELLSTLTKVRA